METDCPRSTCAPFAGLSISTSGAVSPVVSTTTGTTTGTAPGRYTVTAVSPSLTAVTTPAEFTVAIEASLETKVNPAPAGRLLSSL
ncbi:MAG: hypothetical protein BWY09_00689 [Candidatus Hydrogenedentes bacterium ADurb.Bin179]|nr:MAG: hypothetical protein BWY09_00689 [Candidatus Hydrogenedentes bacterium ADurb.Bin179]